MGHEDIFESVAGVAGTVHVFRHTPVTGTCDTGTGTQNWFDQLMGTRQMVSTDPAKLGNYGGTSPIPGVYDRLTDPADPWISSPVVANGERLAAISAIYMGAALSHFGQFYCEGAIDGGQLITATQFLTLADEWYNRADGHITTAGDFAMPNGAATGTTNARNTVRALRALNYLAMGPTFLDEANTEAAAVLASSATFAFNITRESGTTRRNKPWRAGTAGSPFSGMVGVNSYWGGPTRQPNPATGQQWPDVIPFTGYIFLGIQPDGRTLEVDNTPVRWAQELRNSAEQPVSLANGAVQDPRVTHTFKSIQGPAKREVPSRFTSDANPIPFATFEELNLIRALFENQVNNNQAAAITIINNLRPGAAGCTPVSATCVPNISGALNTQLTNGALDNGVNDQTQMRYVILEEARRLFYGGESGRWYQWKIQNTDLMWFPRFQGYTAAGVYRLQGGVRMQFPNDEYQRNTNFTGGLADRGAGCTGTDPALPADESERPVLS
jgi:hypothetical protein